MTPPNSGTRYALTDDKWAAITPMLALRRADGGKIMNAVAGTHDAAMQMIDTSIVRVHPIGLD